MTQDTANSSPERPVLPEVCPLCGLRADQGSPGPCDACCAEFQLTRSLNRPALVRLERSMRNGLQLLAVICTCLGLVVGAWSLASWLYGGSLPDALSGTLRLAQIAVMLLLLWVSLRLDTAVRELPSALVRPGAAWQAVLVRLEERVPGAALATLAILTPWSIGIWRRGVPLASFYLLLAMLTMVAAVMLWLRIGLYQRSVSTCGAELAARAGRWVDSRPAGRARGAILFWLLASFTIPLFPWIGVGRAYSRVGAGGLEQWVWCTVWSALYVAEVLWLGAFVDARRHLAGWLRG